MKKTPLVRKPKTRKPRRTLEQKTAQQLVKEADTYFSWYIRLRDSHLKDGVWTGTCITCSKSGPVAYMDETSAKGRKTGAIRYVTGWDAGHFVSRGHKVVRFNEQNVNLQCAFRCNKMNSGEYEKYRLALKDKYGDDVPEELENLARSTTFYKFSKPELLQIIADAKEQIKEYEESARV